LFRTIVENQIHFAAICIKIGNFNGDFTVQIRVVGTINGAEAAGTKLRFDSVPPEVTWEVGLAHLPDAWAGGGRRFRRFQGILLLCGRCLSAGQQEEARARFVGALASDPERRLSLAGRTQASAKP